MFYAGDDGLDDGGRDRVAGIRFVQRQGDDAAVLLVGYCVAHEGSLRVGDENSGGQKGRLYGPGQSGIADYGQILLEFKRFLWPRCCQGAWSLIFSTLLHRCAWREALSRGSLRATLRNRFHRSSGPE